MTEFKICNKCTNNNRFYPTPVYKLEPLLTNFFKKHTDIKSIISLRKNIAYNLQYVEFQVQLQKEFDTTHVILSQNRKMTIIAGMSIIESVLFYLLISKNIHKTTTRSSEYVYKTEGEKIIDGNSYLIQNFIYKKCPEKLFNMNFKQMVSSCQNKELIGPSTSAIYPKLIELIKIRNMVHLQGGSSDTDTDYFNIQEKDLIVLKVVLHTILMSSLFSLNSDEGKFFNYLK